MNKKYDFRIEIIIKARMVISFKKACFLLRVVSNLADFFDSLGDGVAIKEPSELLPWIKWNDTWFEAFAGVVTRVSEMIGKLVDSFDYAVVAEIVHEAIAKYEWIITMLLWFIERL